jgi:hypothetical protein
MALTQRQLVELAHNNAAVEAAGDIEATLATLTADPVYILATVGKKFTGLANARRWYEIMINEFLPRLEGAEMVGEWDNPAGLVQEYKLRVRHGDADIREHAIVAVLTFGEDGISGERMYADATLLRAMAGPMWDELEPI